MQICNSNPSVAFGASSLYTREPWGAQFFAFPMRGRWHGEAVTDEVEALVSM